MDGVRNEQRSTGRPLELEALLPPGVAILMLLNFYRFVLTSWTLMQIASGSCALGKSRSTAWLVATGHEMEVFQGEIEIRARHVLQNLTPVSFRKERRNSILNGERGWRRFIHL